MNKKITLVGVLAFGVGVFGTIPTGQAAPVTIRYQGIIDHVDDPDGVLDGSVVVGGTFRGQYTFESTAPNVRTSTWGEYQYDEKAPAGMTMSVTVGNYRFETENLDPFNHTSWIYVQNNYGSPLTDSYDVFTREISQRAGPTIELEPPWGSIGFELKTYENLSTFASVALPLSMPNLANFEVTNRFTLQVWGPSDILVRGYLAPLVPDVVGRHFANARSAITSAGFVLGTMAYHWSDTVPAAHVISQDPTAGTPLVAGADVDLTISLGPQGGGPEPPPAGLVAHWKLDESSGNTAEDSAGNHDGTLYGNPTWQPTGGMVDGALLLDGFDDYVDVGSVGISGAAPRTIAGWVKASTTDIPNWTNVFGFTNSSGTSLRSFDIERRGGQDYYCIHAYDWQMDIVELDLDWHHLAATYDGTTVTWYAEGLPVGSEDVTLDTIDNVQMGRRADWAGDRFFPGLIDDVRIYDYALTENEIKGLLDVEGLLVPDVVGMSLGDAIAAIGSAGLTIAETDFAYSDVIPTGYVISQAPAAGTPAAAGSGVGLVISLGSQPQATQACCFADGSCQDLTGEQCLAAGGVPQGEGTTCPTTTCPAPVVGALVAHWTLDETQGTIAYDSAGIHDGALYGDPIWQPTGGMVDGALLLDGLDDYVVVGSVGIGGAAPRTIACWAKATTTDIPPWTNVFGFTNSSGTSLRSFDIERRGGQDYYCIHAFDWQMNIVELDLDWHHLAAAYDGTTVTWYAEGLLVGSEDVTLDTIDNVQMGRRSDWAKDRFFPGLIDDARIYDYALSAKEVLQLSCIEPRMSDLNGDCIVDFADFAIFASDWLY